MNLTQIEEKTKAEGVAAKLAGKSHRDNPYGFQTVEWYGWFSGFLMR